MFIVTGIAFGVIVASFGISYFGHRHWTKSTAKDNAVGEAAAILSVIIWLFLIILMAEGIIDL